MPMADAIAGVMDGTLRDSKTVTGLLMAARKASI